MAEIIVAGSLNMDLVVRVERRPEGGETVEGSDLALIPGGKGANQAAAAGRLGRTTAMVGCVGDDAFGPRLVDNLGRQGVDTQHVRALAGCATGTALITVDGQGQNSIVISPAANGRVGREDVDAMQDLWPEARLLLLQFEIPLDTVVYAAETAARRGVHVLLNPAPARRLPRELLRHIHYLVPNESEAGLLTGIEVRDMASAERAGAEMLRWGLPVVILTLGDKGALLCTPEGTVHVAAQRVPVVDTTAAGDAFIGGLAAALAGGCPLQDAVRYATCAGTLAVTRFGAQTSLPSALEVQAFQAQQQAPAADHEGVSR